MSQLARILFAAVICFGLNHGSLAFAKAQTPPANSKLTEPERALVANSRRAIVRTGISETYFDRHFKLVKVVNQPGDRRIVWKFSINEYETIVSDVLGYYTEGGKRIDIHSVATTLRSTSEIKRTISRRDANRVMKRCIGTFAYPSVEYRATDAGTARLVMTAEAVTTSKPGPNEKSPAVQEEPVKTEAGNDIDVIGKKGKAKPPPIFGTVDLQSAKCVKWKGQAGAPSP